VISEGEVIADRISREMGRISKMQGIGANEIEFITYFLLVITILREQYPASSDFSGTYLYDDFAKTAAIFFEGCNGGSLEEVSALYERVLRAMLRLFKLSPAPQWQPSTDASQALGQIARLLNHELNELDNEGKGSVVDMLYYRLFSRLIPSQRRHHELVASLTAPLAGLYGGVYEWQPGPAEAILASNLSSGYSNFPQPEEDRLPTGLRIQLLVIRRLRIIIHDQLFGLKVASHSGDFLQLIDVSTELMRKALVDLPDPFHEGDVLSALVRLRRESHQPQLIVVKKKECRDLKRNASARESLVRNCGLCAVVDFRTPSAKGYTDLVVLVFDDHRRKHLDSVLHIDSRHFCAGLIGNEERSGVMLIGELLRAWVVGDIDKSRLEDTHAPWRLVKFAEAAFESTNFHVPGFYRIAGVDKMGDSNYSLHAERYVGTSDTKVWQPEVEIDPIMDALREGRRFRAVYVIGNNGAGKSLAMRDVATALAIEGFKSLGIAFGSTDRFQRSPNVEPLKSLFTYAGARTFKSGFSARRNNGLIGDLVKTIYRDPDRLRCFEVGLEILGFRPRHFLVPIHMRSTSDHWERLLADVYPLSSSSNSDLEKQELENWQTLPDGAYKLALTRRDSPEIVVFDSLSSGEQQILTMITKITAGVQPDTTVLIDEPEISLHVAWQAQLPIVLRKFSEGLNCSFVVATHSPVVIAAAADKNDRCFVMSDRRLHSLGPDQTRSVESSLFEGFQTYTPFTHHIQERCAEIISRIVESSDEDGGVLNEDQGPLNELGSLKRQLVAGSSPTVDFDIALIDKAMAAVQEIMAP
jgi:hypothetical protein